MNQKIGVVVLGTSVNKYNRPESWKVNAIPDVTPWSNQKINSRGEHLRSGRSRSVYYNNWNMLAPIGASIQISQKQNFKRRHRYIVNHANSYWLLSIENIEKSRYITLELLTIDNDPKTSKGRKFGYLTAVQYLAPATLASDALGRLINMCAYASNGCIESCLNTAGRGGIGDPETNTVQIARIKRTILFMDNRSEYWKMYIKELAAFERKAKRENLIPVNLSLIHI